jgi:hypothetical protein
MRWLIALLLAAPAAAQEVISPEAFLDAVAGRTAHFVLAETGAPVGVERFLDRERTVWTRADGRCALGVVRTRGAQICFWYDDEPDVPHCWLPYRDGDLHVRAVESGEVQRVARIDDAHVGCEGEPIS